MNVLFLAFSQSEVGEITTELEEYLKSIASTGQTLYVSRDIVCVVILNIAGPF